MGFPGKISGSAVSSVVKSRPRDKTWVKSEWHALLQRTMQIKSTGLVQSGKFRGVSALNRLIACASVEGGISCVRSTVREIFAKDRSAKAFTISRVIAFDNVLALIGFSAR
ncbi:unnamed protein product [Lasius platythorax]|uniref:Uncharacterized protein n=1 Tax=Lasius platythorax TaxID=488582 RepID=A0AAV2NAQ3_9HYME